MIKLLIAEDIQRLAIALKAKVELMPDVDVKEMFSNGKLLIKYLQRNSHVDVVLMDINMPVMDGIEATTYISEKWPHIKVIMSTVFDDDDHLFKAILAGAKGYLLKDETAEKIESSIREVLDGGAPMSPSIALKAISLIKFQPIANNTEDFGLSKREIEVLEHLSTGLTYDEIAGNLTVSTGTIRKHVENIYRKLHVHSKVEAVQKASKFRLF